MEYFRKVKSMSERIMEKSINEIISKSFIDYSREVIENRAIPDARDGLKPVQRRILYAMYELGLTHDKPHRKSARVVGDVLGKYHPHGDTAVYEALVKMAQPFSRRYILAEGQGNFGTIDDKPAAMRYTEVRLSPLADYLLSDLEKNTVEWQDNFDDTAKEPVVLPGIFPNLIVNGASGIAVGLSTSIPTHNLQETIDGICAYIENPNITSKGLMKYIQGPDFPTGGVVDPQGLEECYESGTGQIRIRGRAYIEELPNNKRQLVIAEIPWQVGKAKLLKDIVDYIEKRSMDDVEEVRDESDQEGTRLVIEMKAGGNAEKLLEELYAKTALETSFSYNMVALIDGKPVTMSLKDMIAEYTKHKQEVIRRRTEFDLKKAKDRKHILEGMVLAVQNIDDIIKIIKKSKTTAEARERLIKKYSFSEKQAQAILEIRLQRLTAFEVKALQEELKELEALVAKYKNILSSDKNILKELKKELSELKKKHADERKTQIGCFETMKISKAVEKFTLQINEDGTVKKLSADYRGQKGIVLKTDSTKTIMAFTEDGEAVSFTGYHLPEKLNKKVAFVCNTDDFKDDDSLIFVTSDGMVKKTFFREYSKMNGAGKAIRLNPGAKVVGVGCDSFGDHMVLLSEKGYVIRFDHTDIRQIGRISMGVKGMQLEDGDSIKFMAILPSSQTNGKAGAVDLKNIKVQGRGGKGSILRKKN